LQDDLETLTIEDAPSVEWLLSDNDAPSVCGQHATFRDASSAFHRFGKQLHESALELIGFYVDCADITSCLAAGNRLQAAELLEEARGEEELHAACLLRFVEGDEEGTRRILSELPTRDEMQRARKIGFQVLLALKNEEPSEALKLLETDLPQHVTSDEIVRLWPTWSLLLGYAQYLQGDPRKAAKSFVTIGSISRGGSILPVQLAVHCLIEVGEDTPDEAHDVIQKGWATKGSFQRAAAAIEKAVRSGPSTNAGPSAQETDGGHEVKSDADGDAPQVKQQAQGEEEGSEPAHSEVPAMEALAKAVRAYIEAFAKVRTDAGDLDLDALKRATEELDRLRAAVEASDLSLRKALGSRGKVVPVLSKQQLATPKAAAEYLDAAQRALALAIAAESTEVRRSVQDLERRYRRAGVEVPPELATLRTREELEQFDLERGADLRTEEICRDLWQRPSAFEVLEGASAADRGRVYAKLIDRGWLGLGRYEFLAAVIDDEEALTIDRAEGLRVLTSLLLNALVENEPLPAGTWAMLRSLCDGNLSAHLSSSGVPSLLDGRSPVDLDREGLCLVLSSEEGDLPSPLGDLVELACALDQPTQDGVRRIARIVKRRHGDPVVLNALFQGVVQQEMWGEALFLASIGARKGWLDVKKEDLKDIVFRAVLELNDIEGDGDDLVEQLRRPEYLIESAEDCVAGVFLAAQISSEDLFYGTMYSDHEKWNQAIALYPQILDRLGQAISTGETGSADGDPKYDEVAEAYTDWRGFQHDLQRKRVLSNWTGSEDLQNEFRKKLLTLANGIVKGKRVQDVATAVFVEEMIKSVEKRGGGPRIEGKGRQVARQFLVRQLARLERVSSAAERYGAEVVLRGPSEGEEIKEELRLLKERGASSLTIGFVANEIEGMLG
jgi:tetratricopeptide (TPR) repeat protein